MNLKKILKEISLLLGMTLVLMSANKLEEKNTEVQNRLDEIQFQQACTTVLELEKEQIENEIELTVMALDESSLHKEKQSEKDVGKNKIKKREKTYSDMEVPNINNSFKPYMDYRTITNKESAQWKLQRKAQTDSKGFRTYNGRKMVAVGTYYADYIGKELLVVLENGMAINVVVGDFKDNRHTDKTNRYVPSDKNMVEFIVDVNKIGSTSRKMGDMSYSGFKGKIVAIKEVVK